MESILAVVTFYKVEKPKNFSESEIFLAKSSESSLSPKETVQQGRANARLWRQTDGRLNPSCATC